MGRHFGVALQTSDVVGPFFDTSLPPTPAYLQEVQLNRIRRRARAKVMLAGVDIVTMPVGVWCGSVWKVS
jgi:hypothetical protein